MKYILITVLVLLFTGCSYIALIVDDPYDYPDDRIYNASFDDTWSAVLKAIEWYPIITIEKDSGVLLTGWVDDFSPNQFWVTKSLTDSGFLYGIGVKLIETDASGLIVISVLKGGPADIAGIKVGDYILSVDGHELNTEEAFSIGVNSKGLKNMKIKRKSTGDFEEMTIKPIKLYDIFRKVSVKYRFNIRVSSIDSSHTEVRVINHEKAQDRYNISDYSYYYVSSATIREKIILDRTENILMGKSTQ